MLHDDLPSPQFLRIAGKQLSQSSLTVAPIPQQEIL
jgi:hypothetical protein